MRIGIDLDGVCYDFGAALRLWLTEGRGWSPQCLDEPTRWEFYEDWGLSLEEFNEECAAGVNAGYIFSKGQPFPGTGVAFDQMKRRGHSLHIVTDRKRGNPGESERATLRWLDAYGLTYDSITFSADKTIADIDVMIDDKLENYDALEEVGVWAYLLDRPWNQRFDRHRERVSSLAEFADIMTGVK